MNTETIKARRVASVSEVEKPGDYYFSDDRRHLYLLLPGDTIAGRVRIGGSQHPCWEWDGNLDSPTLTPSLDLPGVWHGWLQAGIFRSC
jgi:hypothetical protein